MEKKKTINEDVYKVETVCHQNQDTSGVDEPNNEKENKLSMKTNFITDKLKNFIKNCKQTSETNFQRKLDEESDKISKFFFIVDD